jgi:GNAT superfamily N-acetyltransferase
MKTPVGYSLLNDEHDLCRLCAPATALAKASGVHILRDRELAATLVTKEGDLAGALWTASDSSSFTFDVVVDKSHQRKGLGGYLIDRALASASDYEECGAAVELHVISPDSQRLLERRGFVMADQRVSSGCVMVKPGHPLAIPSRDRDLAEAGARLRSLQPDYIVAGQMIND